VVAAHADFLSVSSTLLVVDGGARTDAGSDAASSLDAAGPLDSGGPGDSGAADGGEAGLRGWGCGCESGSAGAFALAIAALFAGWQRKRATLFRNRHTR